MNLAKKDRAARYAARRALIINAACELFHTQGIRGTLVSDIARLCHISVGQVYRCFHNKEEIVCEIIHYFFQLQINRLVTEDMNLKTEAQALAGTQTANTVFWQQGNSLLLEIYTEATRNEKIATILYEASRRLMQKRLARLRKYNPGMSECRLKALAEVMSVLQEGAFLRFQHRNIDKTEGEILSEIYSDIFRCIFTSETKKS